MQTQATGDLERYGSGGKSSNDLILVLHKRGKEQHQRLIKVHSISDDPKGRSHSLADVRIGRASGPHQVVQRCLLQVAC
jgi:hypothetical protein